MRGIPRSGGRHGRPVGVFFGGPDRECDEERRGDGDAGRLGELGGNERRRTEQRGDPGRCSEHRSGRRHEHDVRERRADAEPDLRRFRTVGFSAALTTDGTNVYRSDESGIYACAAGATFAQPFTLTSLKSPDGVYSMVPSGGDLYWVNEDAATVESVPISGGPVSTVCTLPPNPPGTEIPSTLAVVDGYAYVTGAWGGSLADGIERCALDGGSSTPYFTAMGTMDVETDGSYVYWISGQTGHLEACLPGPTCAAEMTLPAPGNIGGFVLSGGYAYWTTLAVGRVPLP